MLLLLHRLLLTATQRRLAIRGERLAGIRRQRLHPTNRRVRWLLVLLLLLLLSALELLGVGIVDRLKVLLLHRGPSLVAVLLLLLHKLLLLHVARSGAGKRRK